MSDRSPTEAAVRLWPDQDAAGFHFFDFLHARGSPRQALFYSGLFWPEFIEREDMVFLEGTIEDESDRQRLLEALHRYGDRTKTEQSFNTVEIPSLFGRRSTETTDEEDEYLANRICTMWTARLRELFPDRKFFVEVLPADESGGEISIRFYQRT